MKIYSTLKENTLNNLKDELKTLTQAKYDVRSSRMWGDSVSSSLYYYDTNQESYDINESIEEIQEQIRKIKNDLFLPDQISLIKRALLISLYAWHKRGGLTFDDLKRGLKITQNNIFENLVKYEIYKSKHLIYDKKDLIYDRKLIGDEDTVEIVTNTLQHKEKIKVNEDFLIPLSSKKIRFFPSDAYQIIRQRAKKIKDRGIHYYQE